ncbi:hypothetical protein [Streptomyces sp. SID12488]|uniref:hypothetical protein n=1 Tax=Streptomyces sp. SID12488 TaxID=2706040 RepID=UPI0013DCF665|nr:hypothetical protein [Streptomyces sp. SID12488]NEA66221.1 hypothetical protein [Streptomyces sp. SID12488]
MPRTVSIAALTWSRVVGARSVFSVFSVLFGTRLSTAAEGDVRADAQLSESATALVCPRAGTLQHRPTLIGPAGVFEVFAHLPETVVVPAAAY